MLARLSHATVRMLDWLAAHTLPPDPAPAHQRIGRRGEEDAYFICASSATSWSLATSARHACGTKSISSAGANMSSVFFWVQSRTTHDVKPAEAAVDRDK